jgi:hypothetical protein
VARSFSRTALFLVALAALGCHAELDEPNPNHPASGGSVQAGGAGGSSATPGVGGSAAGSQATGGSSASGGAVSAGTSGAGASSTGGSSTGGSGGLTDPAAECAASAGMLQVGLTRLRRMTRSQFNHTVRDLLGVTGTPADALAPDEKVGPFYANAIAPVTDLLVQQHGEVADALAAQVASRMNEIAGCDLATGGAACAMSFVQSFGLKAYRRPLAQDEVDQYVALYTGEIEAGTPESAFMQIVSTFLQSPFFLYHADVGTTGVPSEAPVALTPYELASRLSYFLWDTMPDAELFTLAGAGTLTEKSVLSAQVDRMIADPKAVDAIPEFHLGWLQIGDLAGLDKDATLFPSWNATLATAMKNETARFTDFVVRQGDGLMSTLYTAGFSLLDTPLLSLYGVTAPAGFVDGAQITLPAGERSGILTHASLLSSHAHRNQTSPVHRGIVVRENMLCQPLDPPPLDVNVTPPEPTPATTTRERFANHEADPQCAGCHLLIDPIGLSFENYDAIGAYRTVDGPAPVDASGEIVDGGEDLVGPFVGAIELGQKLAESPTARDCLANQWFRFALDRIESVDDACSVATIHQEFAASGGNIRSLLAGIAKSDAFRNVRAVGVTQ